MTGEEIIGRIRGLEEFNGLVGLPCVGAVVVAGGLAKGSYVDGWSDIDLQIIMSSSPDRKYFQAVRDLLGAIRRDLGEVKAGVESVDKILLMCAVTNEHLTTQFYKFLKPYYKRSEKPFLVLFLAPEFVLPVVTDEVIQKVDFGLNTSNIINYMYKYMADEKSWIAKKSTFRKIIKNVQLLVSGFQATKNGYVSDNFEEVAAMDPNLATMIPTVGRYFSNRSQWSSLSDASISDDDLDLAWKEFVSVANYYKEMI
jgi:predicted nucleotidyltransferase